MHLRNELKKLIDELDRLHSGAVEWDREDGFPDYVTAENGMQRQFNKAAIQALLNVSKVMHLNRPKDLIKIEVKQYEKIVRQVVADMHADGMFINFQIEDDERLIPKLKALIEERIASASSMHTHYFPSWTLGMEQLRPFTLGPVTFMSRADWIDSVNFPERALAGCLGTPEANLVWKETLKTALQKPNDGSAVEGLAGIIYTSISKCTALTRVTIHGYEREFSRKLARIVAKAALDALSLVFGAQEAFLQQALQDERLPPVRISSFVETDGMLWFPGWELGGRVPRWSHEQVLKTLDDLGDVLPALGAILDGLVDPVTCQCPKLSTRWATALDWYGEACREANDAIALAKLGTSLDVLSAGGKNVGICEMVSHLTGMSKSRVVISGPPECTLERLVKEIYDFGRSQILHGTHYDRLKSFARDRAVAAQLARIVLLRAAQRLQNYSGSDEDKAFRSM